MASGSPTKSAGKKMTMASALFGEKLAHWRADIRLGLYRLSHSTKEDREAAQESNIVEKSVATGTLAYALFIAGCSIIIVLIIFRNKRIWQVDILILQEATVWLRDYVFFFLFDW